MILVASHLSIIDVNPDDHEAFLHLGDAKRTDLLSALKLLIGVGPRRRSAG
jgi:hypothetical protein